MARHAARRSVVTILVTCAVVLGGGTVARAEPSAAEIEKQIDVAWNQLEPVIERHNATRLDLDKKKRQIAALTKKIEPLQVQIDVAMARVGEFAAEQYKGGNLSTINALLTTGSPTTFGDHLVMLDQFARRSQADIQAVVDLRNQYSKQKEPLDQLVAQLSTTEAELAARKKQIDGEIEKLEDMRLRAYGSGGTTGALAPVPCPYTYPGGAAGTAVKFACAQIGKMYQYGSGGPGTFDCSGLTSAAWAKAGVSLPHNAAAQRRATDDVSRSNLRAGDLVFYYSDLHHVGMYVGGGWIVHASRTGEPIRMRKLDAAPVHSFGRPG
ncbi:C40 family peptidase [Micromonospora sp. CPCC 206061]|uniref:C40 family peptidase n=1 Tax=Micromonospora sp. CPCC 206061 TaxID=3122410 RepID=UPI002FEE6BC5